MKIHKLIASTLLMSSTMALSNEGHKEIEPLETPSIHSSYSYVGLGIGPLPCPAFTISAGRRSVLSESFAVDAGINLATLIRLNAARGYVNGLFYTQQKPKSQYYLGLGASVGGVFGISSFYDGGFAAPNLLVGKEFLNASGKKRFFQAEVLYPIYYINERTFINWPLLTLKYGISF